MPRKKEITVFKFSELSDRAKEKARDGYREGALDYEWWDTVYEDAKNIGLKITGFDLGRGSYVEGSFTKSADDVAKLILEDHGKDTETYKDARDFLADQEKKWAKEKEEEDEDEDKIYGEVSEEDEEEFLKTLCEDYRIILEKEMEYLTSNEAIDESIEANEPEFNEDGTLA